MKLLKDILYRVPMNRVVGSTNIAIQNICFDSREVGQFSVFVAIRGTQSDGHDYIQKTVEGGVLAVVCEQVPEETVENVTYVETKDSNSAIALMACNFYENPSNELKLIGITGTNGKTTTVTILHQLFMNLGHKCGLLSTVVNKIQREEIPSTHTTPNPIELNRLLRQMVDEGCSHCFMEVSSHALVQRRTEGLNFKIGIFTNITHDHLDYHGTFDEYIKAKKMLFDDLGTNSYALLNRDDFHNEVMVQNTKAKVFTYGLKTMADFKCKIIENDFTGLLLNVENKEVWTRLIGRFNAYNVLTAYSTAKLLGEDSTEVLTEISNLTPVRGRFQQIKGSSGITGIVDYAHTPDALLKVLETINEIKTDDQQVFTIIGCGGNRDKTKRPEMAKIAVQNSNKVILTSDNPRNEDPESIIMDMEKGVDPVNSRKTLAITNRKEAIKAAVSQAKPNDIILIAGKGHETYQLIGDQVLDFNDMEILTEYLKQFAS